MKRLALALWLLALSIVATADVVRMRADFYYPVNAEPDSEAPGYMIEIARLALERRGHQLDYMTLPWERSIDQARRGTIDCLPGVHADSVPDFILTQQSFGIDRMGLFARRDADAWTFQSLADLQGKLLAVVSGYRYNRTMDAYIAMAADSPGVQVTKGSDALQRNIKMLLAGRVDLILEAIPAFEHTARQMGVFDQVKLAATLPETSALYIACTPGKSSSQRYVDILDEGLHELRRSGELQRILDKYGVTDWGR